MAGRSQEGWSLLSHPPGKQEARPEGATRGSMAFIHSGLHTKVPLILITLELFALRGRTNQEAYAFRKRDNGRNEDSSGSFLPILSVQDVIEGGETEISSSSKSNIDCVHSCLYDACCAYSQHLSELSVTLKAPGTCLGIRGACYLRLNVLFLAS